MQNAFKFEEEQLMDEVSQWEHSEAEKGQVYTRPEVVDFMLTTMGLNIGESLKDIRVLEPSCGEGEFVLAIAKCLISLPKNKPTVNQLLGKIVAIDIVGSSIEVAKSKIMELLLDKKMGSGLVIKQMN